MMQLLFITMYSFGNASRVTKTSPPSLFLPHHVEKIQSDMFKEKQMRVRREGGGREEANEGGGLS